MPYLENSPGGSDGVRCDNEAMDPQPITPVDSLARPDSLDRPNSLANPEPLAGPEPLANPDPLAGPDPLGGPEPLAGANPFPGLGASTRRQPADAKPVGDPFAQRSRPFYKRAGGALAALGALLVKFGAYLKGAVFLLPKLKLLTTAGTALVSVAAYSLFWGWPFAVGFVVLLFVHEMGHVLQLRREGIKASTPMFIPFMGAVITSRSLGDNALAEARVGLAGPVLGSIGAAGCLVVAEATGSDFFRALAYVGFLLNLFNLIPVVPLDGGRAMAAMAPWMWFVGFASLIPLLFVLRGGFVIVVILVLGAYEIRRRWRLRKSGSLEQAAYYRVAPRHRLMVGVVYVGLVVALALGMDAAHVLTSSGHSFHSL
jgi:Zn-dependent protease